MRAKAATNENEVVLGDDYLAMDDDVEAGQGPQRDRVGFFALSKSSLARKIITFNLVALNILIAGILYLNSSRDSLALQRANGLISEVELIAEVFEAQLPQFTSNAQLINSGRDVNDTLEKLNIRAGIEVFVFDAKGQLVGHNTGSGTRGGSSRDGTPTLITDGLKAVWRLVSTPFSSKGDRQKPQSFQEQAQAQVQSTLENGTQVVAGDASIGTVFSVATPVMHDDEPVAVVALLSTSGEIDNLVASERERVLQMFLVATVVSIGLSLILASTIANPLSDLATAAESVGKGNHSMGDGANRIRIPDLTARPDEIGRLSAAIRGMVGALYHRIESNEIFAADVAHEIKNPLASLRSAVGTMRIAKTPEQQEKLLSVVEHDVRRLDRLVSDISRASRLDGELVKEEQEAFDLTIMLRNLGEFLGEEARKKGIDFITDFPKRPVIVYGLEARLAQVFVNLITNAISFCEEGDAIRLWARKRGNRVLVMVEDTGIGIPEQALDKVFNRFYSERSEKDFGNNSGLGLAISKQIIEAHDGVIWAENIQPTDADITSDPLGARFVVGLPV
jgi:two-component system sensor histidine kinase ChvG